MGAEDLPDQVGSLWVISLRGGLHPFDNFRQRLIDCYRRLAGFEKYLGLALLGFDANDFVNRQKDLTVGRRYLDEPHCSAMKQFPCTRGI